MINILGFISLVFIFGWTIESLFGFKNLGEKIGNSILIGSLLMTVIMLADYQVINNFNINRVIIIIAFISIILSLILRNKMKLVYEKINFSNIKKIPNDHKLLIGLIGIFFFITLVINYSWPISDWDAIALYDFRSQIIKTGNWDIGVELGYFFHYPPFTSLLHGASYLLGFERAKIFYSLLYLGFCVSFYSLLKRRLSTFRSLIGVFLLTITPLLSGHVIMAYTNLPYAIYFSLGVIYTWEWLSNRKDSDLIHAFIFIAGGSWIRQAEPFWIIPILLIFITQLVSKKRSSWTALFSSILIFVGLYNYWPIYVSTLNLPPPTSMGLNDNVVSEATPVNLGTIIGNMFKVTSHLLKWFFTPLITFLLPISIIVLFDEKLRTNKYFLLQLLTISAFFIFVVGGTFIFSFTYATWDQIGGSLTRMIMFFEPLFIYMLMFSTLWFIEE